MSTSRRGDGSAGGGGGGGGKGKKKGGIIGVGYEHFPAKARDTLESIWNDIVGEDSSIDDDDGNAGGIVVLPLDEKVQSGVFYAFGCPGVPPSTQKTQEVMQNWYHTHRGDVKNASIRKVFVHRATKTMALELGVGYDVFVAFVNHKAAGTLKTGTSALKEQIRAGQNGWEAFVPKMNNTITVRPYMYASS